MQLLETILEKMSSLTKPQKNFADFIDGLMCLRGRATYSNLSRYSELSEKTYQRWFGKKLDFMEFNRLGINEIIPASHEKIAVLDCSFMEKSGENTYGLGKFYNSTQGKAEKGLEISTSEVIDVDYNTAYHVSTRQTPTQAKMPKKRACMSI